MLVEDEPHAAQMLAKGLREETAWYSLVVSAVLATSVIAIAVVQGRRGVERLDGELQRLMLTLEGVMRTEFNEGLTLQELRDQLEPGSL